MLVQLEAPNVPVVFRVIVAVEPLDTIPLAILTRPYAKRVAQFGLFAIQRKRTIAAENIGFNVLAIDGTV